MAKRKKAVAPLLKVQRFPGDYSLEKTGISQSLLTAYQACRVRFLLTLNRWHHVGGKPATVFGSLVHDVLDKMYSAPKMPSYQQITQWVDEFQVEEGTTVDPQQMEYDKAKANAVLVLYRDHYKDDFAKKKFAGVETVFQVRFGDKVLRGKIDGTYTDKSGKLWLMEHKTKSRISEDDLFLKLAFDLQNLFYITAYEAVPEHDPVTGVLYNIIRNPGTKPRQGEVPAAYGQRITEEARKRPEYYFLRFEVPYTTPDKKRFREELEIKLDEIDDLIHGDIQVYRNECCCEAPYRCEYLNACASGNMTGYVQTTHLFPELQP
jgi:hypothetical protein